MSKLIAPMSPLNGRTRITFEIDDVFGNQLERVAEANKTSVSDVVRHLVRSSMYMIVEFPTGRALDIRTMKVIDDTTEQTA